MSQTDSLVARLDLLEQSNRRLKWLVALLGACCVAALALSVYVMVFRSSPGSSGGGGLRGAAEPDLKVKSLAVEKLVLLDPEGKPVAILGEDDSWPWGQYRRTIPGFKPPHGLYLRNEHGQPRIGMFATSQGAAHFDFLDDQGKIRMTMIKSPDDQTLFACNNAAETTAVMMGIGQQKKPLLLLRGDSMLGLNDDNGTTRASMLVNGGEGSVVVQDANGQVIRRLP
jgi:hypothetical protein